MLKMIVTQAGALPKAEDMTEAIRVAMTEITDRLFRRAFINLSGRIVQARSGRTARSLHGRVVVSGNAVVGAINTDWFVGRILEKGARAVEISASQATRRGRSESGPEGVPSVLGGRRRRKRRGQDKAKALAFDFGGRRVIVQRVSVPPRRPRPWASTALKETESDAAVIFERQLRQVLEAAGTDATKRIISSG